MRKFLFAILLFGMAIILSIQPVRAHLVGAFQDFLIGLQNEDSDKLLKEAVEETEGKRTSLEKNVKEQEALYENEQEKMMELLTFYDTVAVDAYASLLFQEGELVDILANQELIKQKVHDDVQHLERFYDRFQQLEQALESVRGYGELLNMIEDNQTQKERLTTIFPNLLESDKEAFASLLQAIWEQDMVKVDEHLIADSNALSEHIKKWTAESYTNGIRTLSYKELNEHTTMTYLIQSDHVYVSYEKGDGHLILITQIKKHPQKAHSYYLEIEAGFLNGYTVSTSILEKLNGLFVFSYEGLINDTYPDWIVQQSTNQLLFQPSTTAID